MDGLAAEGVLFERAFTPIPSTLPSHCSILTSSYPASHGVHDNGVYFLEDAATTLAEVLDEEGYETGAFVSAFVLDRQFKLGTHAVIATQSTKAANIEDINDFSLIVRQISIDKLAEEPKKLNPNQRNHTQIDKNPNDALC